VHSTNIHMVIFADGPIVQKETLNVAICFYPKPAKYGQLIILRGSILCFLKKGLGRPLPHHDEDLK